MHVGARRQAHVARRRQAQRQPHLLGADLVHGSAPSRARREPVYGTPSASSRPCSTPSSPPPLLPCRMLKTRSTLPRTDRIDQRRDAVDRVRIDAARTQRVEHVAAGIQRHLALGAGAAHQHGDAAEAGRIVEPERRRATGSCALLRCIGRRLEAGRRQLLRGVADVAGAHHQQQVAVVQHVGQHARPGRRRRPTTTGSMRPRARIARASDFASAPAIGASPAA